MSNILITGASGYIGSNLARRLSKSGNKISIFVRRESNLWRLKDIISYFDTHVIDISDVDVIKQKIKRIKPDIVYHSAAYGVYPSQQNLNMIIQTNIVGSVNLMKVLAEYNDLERFINIGSSFEYGPKLKAIRETEIIEPTTPYGIAKATQTHFAQYFAFQNDLPIVTLRIFTTYGIHEEPGRLISDIMLALIRKSTLSLGSPKVRRDFIYIDDVIDALLKTAKTKKIEGEIFNIGSGREYNLEEIVNLVKAITHMDLNILWDDKKQHELDRTGMRGFAHIEKAKKILHWKPRYSIKQGLLETYNWYRKNIDLYPLS
ncbi:MAG: NAD-dependent epimerase/dehydratase family protein [Nitrosopumilaceae archaeon]